MTEGREALTNKKMNKTLSELKQDTNEATPRFHRFAYAEEDVNKRLKKLKEDLKKELNLDFKNGFDMTDTINWINKFDIEESIDKIFKESLGELE